ncbi:Importin-5 [Nymphon striatum]|nr:Importin-5 [Nymphon striatum]
MYFYFSPRFIPCLKYILQNANSPELKVLRGKTIECISLIGLAVGKEKFIPDSEDIMKLLLKSQTNEEELADDDPQVAYMIAAWARICKILGSDFLPYIPLVMGLIMKTASIKPEVAVLNNDEIPNADDEDWQFVNLGDQQNFGIRTAGLDEKATACQMLVCYARELKEGFADYAEEVLRLMVPMLRFYFHDSVRIAAAESLPLLLECAKVKGQPFIEGMWNFMLPELLKSLETEPDNDVLGDLMHSLAKCIELLGKGCLTEINMTELLTFMDKMLKNHFEKAADRQKQRKDEDYDEQVEEALVDEDDEDVYLLSKVCDIVHSIFYTHKEEFFLYFDRLLPNFVLLLAPERPWSDHQWGLCIFDDLIEHGGPACIKYQEYFLRPLITYVTDGSAEVRQAAAYGVGVLGQFGGEGFAQTCAVDFALRVPNLVYPESLNPKCLTHEQNNSVVGLTESPSAFRRVDANKTELFGFLAEQIPLVDFGHGRRQVIVTKESIPQLLEVIRAPESRSPENASATENAIAAITKILKYNASKIINTEEILTHWLSWLPVHEDEDEAPHVYNYLCDLIENNHPVILGENNCNIPRLIAIMAEVFCHEILDSKDEVTQRMIRIVRQVQSNNDVFSACLSQMNKTISAVHIGLKLCINQSFHCESVIVEIDDFMQSRNWQTRSIYFQNEHKWYIYQCFNCLSFIRNIIQTFGVTPYMVILGISTPLSDAQSVDVPETDSNRKKAMLLLLHYVGTDCYEIYETMLSVDDTYENIKSKAELATTEANSDSDEDLRKSKRKRNTPLSSDEEIAMSKFPAKPAARPPPQGSLGQRDPHTPIQMRERISVTPRPANQPSPIEKILEKQKEIKEILGRLVAQQGTGQSTKDLDETILLSEISLPIKSLDQMTEVEAVLEDMKADMLFEIRSLKGKKELSLNGLERIIRYKMFAGWEQLKDLRLNSLQRRRERYLIIYTWRMLERQVPNIGMVQDVSKRG